MDTLRDVQEEEIEVLKCASSAFSLVAAGGLSRALSAIFMEDFETVESATAWKVSSLSWRGVAGIRR